ncbi:unnamed protein product, partial [Oppiella nova]
TGLSAQTQLDSTSISISEIGVRIRELIKSDALKHQFRRANSALEGSCDYALSPENLDKNRYGRWGYGVPYDATRVELHIVDKEANSDYINASHVDGYRSAGRYIACQGPLEHTVGDMWRMVWQYGCAQVVMLTNSRGPHDWHCAKYWPEWGPVCEPTVYGNGIKVRPTGRQVADGYTVRTFQVERDGEDAREVVHYNYTGWPDWGVPDCSHSFLPFLKRVRADKQYTSRKPIVVHCSAGIGRTGSFILIDTMLEMANEEKRIDPLKQLLHIREQRMNLVEAIEQYVFVHQVLMEAL